MEEDEEWKVQSENFKNLGNDAFQKGEIEAAIDYYSRAIELDPENHVFFSNRSAAYMKHDSKSKALKDAEKCIELAPNWGKGYNRLGAAQQALKRYEAAIESFKISIQYDSNNQSLWSSLAACKEAYEADKKAKFAEAAIERAQEEERLKRLDEIKQEVAKEKKIKKEEDELADFFDEVKEKKDTEETHMDDNEETNTDKESNKATEDDLLAGFFSEVLKPKEDEKKINEIDNAKLKSEETKDEKSLTAKYMNAELGTGPDQVARILSSNYKWKNLNPYYVLQLDTDATEEDIKYRYKKLSAKVHPDKLIGIDNAREAFEEVKDAYNKLLDESQKKIIILNIENVKHEVIEERRKLKAKGTKESTLPSLEDEISKKTMKAFADIEMAKRRSDNNARSYSAREKSQVTELQEKLKAESKHEEEWNDIDRREKRVGNWRDFAKTEKKAKVSTYNQEQRDFSVHGKVYTDGKSHKL